MQNQLEEYRSRPADAYARRTQGQHSEASEMSWERAAVGGSDGPLRINH